MYRIKVLDRYGVLVEVPQRTFGSYAEIEDWMDEHHPGRIYVSDFAHKRDERFDPIDGE